MRGPAHEQPNSLHCVVRTLERMALRGIAPEELLAHSGISQSHLRELSELITHAQEQTVFANALRLSGDSGIGLDIGHALHMPSYGILGYTLMVSPTLRSALQTALTFPLLLGSYFELSLQEPGELACLQAGHYSYRSDLEVMCADMCLSSLWTLLGNLLGDSSLRPNRCDFQHPAPGHRAKYATVFSVTPHFDQPHHALWFPAEWLNRPLPYAEPVSHHMAYWQCRQVEQQWAMGSDSLTANVLRLIRQDPAGSRQLGAVATHLKLSERTLRRRLQERNTSFQHLLDQTLCDLATAHMRHNHLSVAQVAERLGYSEVSSFRQAFVRWTGLSPQAYRRHSATSTGIPPPRPLNRLLKYPAPQHSPASV